MPPLGPRGTSLNGESGGEDPEVDDTFCENVLFCQGFEMRAWLYESVKYEMDAKLIWRQKSGRAIKSACPLGTKSGQAPCPIDSATKVIIPVCLDNIKGNKG